jgi:16S rRNA pseudouridine516 synthase
MHLEKILQSQGFGSRKQCRALIEKGQVQVDEKTCLDPKAHFSLDYFTFRVAGQAWLYREKVYIALNKPIGFECSHHPQHHPSVFNLLPPQLIARGLQCVGRLDQDSTGLLLLTDDGTYLHALTHPRRHVPKRYRITMHEPVTDHQVRQLQAGVELLGEQDLLYAHDCVFSGTSDDVVKDRHILTFTIHQGIYHQVKRMIAAVGNHVVALHRTEIGQFKLDGIADGQWVYLDHEQQQSAKKSP